jgi:hypothetical protein
VYYPCHPLHGKTMHVHRRLYDKHGEVIYCKPRGDVITAIPAWMTDPSAANMVVGAPQVSVEALVELRNLLDTLKSSGRTHLEKNGGK